jgi:hypothetical protein
MLVSAMRMVSKRKKKVKKGYKTRISGSTLNPKKCNTNLDS